MSEALLHSYLFRLNSHPQLYFRTQNFIMKLESNNSFLTQLFPCGHICMILILLDNFIIKATYIYTLFCIFTLKSESNNPFTIWPKPTFFLFFLLNSKRNFTHTSPMAQLISGNFYSTCFHSSKQIENLLTLSHRQTFCTSR